MSTKRFYDENGNRPVHETRTLSRAEVYAKLYPRGTGRLSDQPFISAYGSREKQALVSNNYMEATRLKSERAELEKLATELNMDDRQTLRVANAIRARGQKPLPADAKNVDPRDSYRLREKFGAKIGQECIDVDAASLPAINHFISKLNDKPVLREAFNKGNAQWDADVMETAIEVAIDHAIVKPVMVTQ